jgi:glycosyltransferase involved in cell wall biosynthesis
MGIESPRVHWGIHPELLVSEPQKVEPATVAYFFPGGFMSRRKPIEATLEAFRAARGDQLRLVVKSQVDRGSKSIRKAAKRDRRIALIADDLPTTQHLKLFASADVCLAPSRWEGLGLHLYEATALGLPIITNDNPPMNEVVTHEVNGLLVTGVLSGESSGSGIPAFEPDVRELTAAIERLADPGLRAQLAKGAARTRDALPWSRTVDDVSELLG